MRVAVAFLALSFAGASAAGCAQGNAGTARRNGAMVFQQACSSCHSLIGNESKRKSGGDLLGFRLTLAALEQYTAQMPVRRPLSAAAQRAVSEYVLQAERAAARP